MNTLHIEHPISGFATWRAAFDRFAEARTKAGVRAARVEQPLDDDRYVVVELDFDRADQAAAFLAFLQETVWADPQHSPALAGTPTTRILRRVG